MDKINEACPYCGSKNIKKELAVGTSIQNSSLGIKYKPFLTTYYEDIYVDLCIDCGSITRFYIKNTDRPWE